MGIHVVTKAFLYVADIGTQEWLIVGRIRCARCASLVGVRTLVSVLMYFLPIATMSNWIIVYPGESSARLPC